MSQSPEQERAAAVECGPYTRQVTLAGLAEPAVTRTAFLALAELVDDPAVDVDRLEPYLLLTVEPAGPMWVYPVDTFLRNLAARRGDQTRAKQALARLERERAEPEG